MLMSRHIKQVARPSLLRWLSTGESVAASQARKGNLRNGPTLAEFLQSSTETQNVGDVNVTPLPAGASLSGNNEKYYVETYGCQMNVSDTEIVRAIFDGAGYNYTESMEDADIIFVNTCAIRENAEAKVWQRLSNFRKLKLSKPKNERPVVGVLGCMAERLKKKLLESDRLVDVVAGPDAYRDLPRLVQMVRGGEEGSAINVQLSQDETYADILPVREASRVHAFVSIMRGCNNMCSFCIVPFTRGRERSRVVDSIIDEARKLEEQGYKELVLLGQNVNSYHDTASTSTWPDAAEYRAAEGFNNMYKLRNGEGVRFGELLERVAAAVPEMRIRFTSPHPKDFPDEVLHLVRETPNICNQIHLPAQSGNTDMLMRMRRNYTREAYIALADRIREMIPNVAISSDFIAGFCGETEEEHQDTISLIKHVGYEHAFMFAYSMRDRTHASYKLQDDVPEEVKLRRLQEIVTTFREQAYDRNQLEIGKRHVVLIEGPSKRSTPENPTFVGRTDNNKRCHVPASLVPPTLADALGTASVAPVEMQPGDYVVVDVVGAGVNQLNVTPVARTTIKEAAAMLGNCLASPSYYLG